MGNTTVISASPGGAGYSVIRNAFGSLGAFQAFSPAKLGWAYNPNTSAWEGRYSTPTVSCGNVAGSDSGTSPTGLVTSSAAAPSPGGNYFGPLTYSWSYVSGDAGISPSNPNISNPTWSKTIGVGTTSAIWQLTVTDTQTGATVTTTIQISLTWNQTAQFTVQGTDAYNDEQIGFDSSGSVTRTVSAQGSATPFNNIGGVSYTWRYVSGSTAMTIDNPNIQSPTWSSNPPQTAEVGNPDMRQAVWSCFAVDSNNDNASCQINVTLILELLND